MDMDLSFSGNEAAEVLSIGTEQPVTEDKLHPWANGGVYKAEDLLAAHLTRSFARALPDAKPATAAWLAQQVLDQIEGRRWDDLPRRVSVPLDDAGTITVEVDVAEHADVLKVRLATWLARGEERAAARVPPEAYNG